MNDFDRRLLNRLQYGLPLTPQPWDDLAAELNTTSHRIRERTQQLLDEGVLTRFGPLFDIEQLGGAFTLAALSVPEPRFDAVARLLADMPEVAHNYRRDHDYNMWFVLACEDPDDIARCIRRIETMTGLPVLNLPKERTYHVGLHFRL